MEPFFAAAQSLTGRSNCAKRKLGAVVVKDGMVIGRGWNSCRCSGVPRDVGITPDACQRMALPTGQGYELSRPVHAEIAAILDVRPGRDPADFEQCIATVEPTLALVRELFTTEELALLKGAQLYLSGHSYACVICQKWVELAGITHIHLEQGGHHS